MLVSLKGVSVVVDDDDGEWEVIVAHSAGLDVHKDIVVMTARTTSPDGQVSVFRAEFGTFTRDLLKLRDYLVDLGVTRVGMEATGVYWKPVVRHEAPFGRGEMKGLPLRAVAAAC